MGNKIKIGHGIEKKYAAVLATDPPTIDQRMSLLEAKMETIAAAIAMLQLTDKPITNNHNAYDDVTSPNKDGLPIGLVLIGTSRGPDGVSTDYMLIVEELGYSVVHMFEGQPLAYQSLSAAAEAVSGVRRSGWTFWKLEDGRSVKEAFRKT